MKLVVALISCVLALAGPCRSLSAYAADTPAGVNDRTTAARLVAEMLDGKHPIEQVNENGMILYRSGQPWVIPMLEPVLQIQEPANMIGHEDVIYGPRSLVAAAVITRILMNSSVFSQDVHTWAAHQVAVGDRENIRQWWNENKAHFATEDYGAVRPLKTTSQTIPAPPQKPTKPVQSSVPTSPSKAALPVASAASHLPPTVQASTGSGTPVVHQAASASPKNSQPTHSAAAAQSEPVNLPWEFVAAGVLIVTGIIALAVYYNKRYHRET